MNEDARRTYRQGNCDAMALALHQKMPDGVLAVWGFQRQDGDGDFAFEPVHAGLLLRRRPLLWMDVDGLHHEPPHRLVSFAGGGEVVWHEVYPEDMEYTFTSLGVDTAQVEAASALLAADPELREQLDVLTNLFAAEDGLTPLGIMPSAVDIAEGMVLDDASDQEMEAVARMDVLGRIVHRYRHGDCTDMALALAEVTGLPSVSLNHIRIGFLHMAVLARDGRLLDAAGWTSAKAVAQLFGQRQVQVGEPRTLPAAKAGFVHEEAVSTALAALWHLGMAGREPFAGMLDAIERQLPPPQREAPGPELPGPAA